MRRGSRYYILPLSSQKEPDTFGTVRAGRGEVAMCLAKKLIFQYSIHLRVAIAYSYRHTMKISRKAFLFLNIYRHTFHFFFLLEYYHRMEMEPHDKNESEHNVGIIKMGSTS